MLDTEQQLMRLKQRVAAIDRKYAAGRPRPEIPARREKWSNSFVEEWSEGQTVTNEFGSHFQMERCFPVQRQHGSADVGALAELPDDLLDALGAGELPAAPPGQWAFLDTETTGLAGGSGTYAFLIGVGRISCSGFSIRQFFMREYAEERSVLAALEQHLAEFEVLITYNGKSYDQPLLETRYRMNRHKSPFGRMGHLDVLHGARRLWKLRLESCRLMQLEQQILGFHREGDLPGELIPYVYFEYLRSREAQRVAPIFHHNAIDILTLACLTAIVPAAFRSADPDSLGRLGVLRGEDLLGIGRWLLAAGQEEQALGVMKRSVDAGLPDRLLFRALLDIALLEKKLGHLQAALRLFTEVAGCRNDFRMNALLELAKYYEHEERNYRIALEFTEQCLQYAQTSELRHRRARLERRISAPRSRQQVLRGAVKPI